VPKQGSVEDGRESGLTQESDDFVKPDTVADLHAEFGEKGRVGVDAHDAFFDSPVGPLAPIPADQARPSGRSADWSVLLEELVDLIPPLPIAADVHEPVRLLVCSGIAPCGGGFLCRRVLLDH
jgi:hypothetical protein